MASIEKKTRETLERQDKELHTMVLELQLHGRAQAINSIKSYLQERHLFKATMLDLAKKADSIKEV